MTLTAALEAAEALRDELEREVARVRAERLVLRSLDGLKIQESVGHRQAFLERAEQLQKTLRVTQAVAALELGLADPSAESIRRACPGDGGLFEAALGRVRALAATLCELSAVNRGLAERALGFTRAYVQTLAPSPSAYGRLGPLAPASAQAAVSRRA